MTPNSSKLHQTAASASRSCLRLTRRGAAAAALVALLVTSAHLVTAVLAAPHRVPEDLDEAVGLLAAGGAALVLTTWACGAVVTATALAARAAGRTSSTLDALSAALTPLLLRRVLAAALGAAALGGVAGPALAAPAASPTASPTASPASAQEAPLTWPGSSAAPCQPPAPDRPHEVVVLRGDTLWGIAARSLPAGAGPGEVAAAWPRWYRANRATIGADPGLLHPGQHLLTPQDAA